MMPGRGLAAAALLSLVAAPTLADGQWTDAQMPRAGEITVGFGLSLERADGRFRPDGTSEPFTRAYTALIDASLEPQLASVRTELDRILQTLGLEEAGPLALGRIHYDVLVEHTRMPLVLSFAPSDWIAVVGTVPFVQGKAFAAPGLDRATADVGPSSTSFTGNPGDFFGELDARIADLQSQIESGTLSGDELVRAQDLIARARTVREGLAELPGLPFAPTDSGQAGRALHGLYEDLEIEFSTFELELPELALAEPAEPAALGELAAGPEFGIEQPQTRDSGIRLGDIELGIRIQPFDGFRERGSGRTPLVRLRSAVEALWRFPTGTAPAPNRILDPGTGDGQSDLELRSALDLAIGDRFWTSLLVRLNLQHESEVRRLFTSPESPIQRGAFVATVNRDPGDEWSITVVPRFNLTRAITFSAFLTYSDRADDRIRPINPLPADAPFTSADVERGTGYRATTAGFGIRYASTSWLGDRREGLPVEVELTHRRRIHATGGFTPDLTGWQVAFRWYQPVLD